MDELTQGSKEEAKIQRI